MSPALRRFVWLGSLVALAVVMAVAYRHFVWLAPEGAFRTVRNGQTVELLTPGALGVMLVLPVLLFALGRSLADLPWPQRILSVILRFAFLALLAFALSSPVRSESTARVCTVVLVDVSDSVADAGSAVRVHTTTPTA